MSSTMSFPFFRAIRQAAFDLFRLAALFLLLVFSTSATAQITVTQVSPNSFKYDGDFNSASEAQAACNAAVAQYGTSCHPGGWPDQNPVYHWSVYEAGWIQTPAGQSLLFDYWYCELPTLLVEGSHKCVSADLEPSGDPKNDGDVNPCPCDKTKPPPDQPKIGNPINPATGNKFQREVDISPHQERRTLGLTRFYNSSPRVQSAYLFGLQWTTAYDVSVKLDPFLSETKCYRRRDNQILVCKNYPGLVGGAEVSRADNKLYRFAKLSDSWLGSQDVNDTLTAQYDTNATTIIGWTYFSGASGATEKFDGTGRLLSIKARGGATQLLTLQRRP